MRRYSSLFIAFGWLTVLASGCRRAAVCFVGHVRSFMHPHVRYYMRTRLLSRMECTESVTSFFYLALEDPDVSKRPSWDSFSRAPSVNESDVRVALAEFEDAHLHIDESSSQLEKVSKCWRLVLESERKDRPYDWVVRTRPDLAWLEPLVPLRHFPQDRAYVPAHFWPLADHFALVPRHIAPKFFEISEEGSCSSVKGAGIPESALYQHLVENSVPVQVYDGFTYVIARYFEGGNCATLHLAHHFACLMNAQQIDQAACQRAIFRAYAARCRQFFPPSTISVTEERGTVRDELEEEEDEDVETPLRALQGQLVNINRHIEATSPSVGDGDVLPLVLTTSGWDQSQVVGQLAMSFLFRPQSEKKENSKYQLDQLRVRMTSAFVDLTNDLLAPPLPLPGTSSNATLGLHAALVDLWTRHVGTIRCTPTCSSSDVASLWHQPRHLLLAC